MVFNCLTKAISGSCKLSHAHPNSQVLPVSRARRSMLRIMIAHNVNSDYFSLLANSINPVNSNKQ